MDTLKHRDSFASLIIQMRTDHEHLEKALQQLQRSPHNKACYKELCRSYSFLQQDMKLLLRCRNHTSLLDVPISPQVDMEMKESKLCLQRAGSYFEEQLF